MTVHCTKNALHFLTGGKSGPVNDWGFGTACGIYEDRFVSSIDDRYTNLGRYWTDPALEIGREPDENRPLVDCPGCIKVMKEYGL